MEKIKRLNSNKGITLIALIITIIVMLILVAVSISIALNTGLFDAAGKATQKTNIAKEQEKELASGKVTIGNATYNSIEEYTDKVGGTKEVIKFKIILNGNIYESYDDEEYELEAYKGETWSEWYQRNNNTIPNGIDSLLGDLYDYTDGEGEMTLLDGKNYYWQGNVWVDYLENGKPEYCMWEDVILQEEYFLDGWVTG